MIIRVRVGEKNPLLGITVCHYLASLVMPNGDPLDEFFNIITLTLKVDSSIFSQTIPPAPAYIHNSVYILVHFLGEWFVCLAT